MEHEVGRGPSCVTLRVRTLFEDEELRRNVEQKNGRRTLMSQDSGGPDESGLVERGRRQGDLQNDWCNSWA